MEEILVDMHGFRSGIHLASWAGMCPCNQESGGQAQNGKTRKGNVWCQRPNASWSAAAGVVPGVALSSAHRAARQSMDAHQRVESLDRPVAPLASPALTDQRAEEWSRRCPSFNRMWPDRREA
jgi:hypothetical protein